VTKLRKIRWGGWGMWHTCIRILAGKPEDKKAVKRPKYRWKDDIKIALKEIGSGSVVWFHLAPDKVQWHAFVNTVMKYVEFQALTVVITKSSIFWDIMLCSPVKVN
jgi:hypothetical protein